MEPFIIWTTREDSGMEISPPVSTPVQSTSFFRGRLHPMSVPTQLFWTIPIEWYHRFTYLLTSTLAASRGLYSQQHLDWHQRSTNEKMPLSYASENLLHSHPFYVHLRFHTFFFCCDLRQKEWNLSDDHPHNIQNNGHRLGLTSRKPNQFLYRFTLRGSRPKTSWIEVS